jgi:hypothetical protein
MPWDAFEDAKKKATKILGASADMPKEKVDFDKLLAAASNGLKQTSAIYEKNDFGLGPKKKDDTKKIAQARQMISTILTTGQTNVGLRSKDLDELGKHTIQMYKYKSPADS